MSRLVWAPQFYLGFPPRRALLAVRSQKRWLFEPKGNRVGSLEAANPEANPFDELLRADTSPEEVLFFCVSYGRLWMLTNECRKKPKAWPLPKAAIASPPPLRKSWTVHSYKQCPGYRFNVGSQWFEDNAHFLPAFSSRRFVDKPIFWASSIMTKALWAAPNFRERPRAGPSIHVTLESRTRSDARAPATLTPRANFSGFEGFFPSGVPLFCPREGSETRLFGNQSLHYH